MKAVSESSVDFPTLNNVDFFPYRDKFYNYWSGFYATRPLIKKVNVINVSLRNLRW